MPATAIRSEMRPKGVLRDVIRELADASGAYVIVSAQGSVTDSALSARRQAIRAALFDLPNAAQLLSTSTIAIESRHGSTNIKASPLGCVAKLDAHFRDGAASGNWECRGNANLKPYLSDDNACLIDEGSRDRKHVTISEGINRLRDALRTPQQCIRLIGLSGVGKTRLVQALFEPDIGNDPLDPSLAVYTDYSKEPTPTAREMARQLIARRQHAILVVDNCNPSTHSELARLCASDGSVSLITVEYDVRDDEPEHTDVFRLRAASPELVTEWIKQSFPHVSQVDRERIAEFSDGNFRVAGALAQTVRRGETLGSLRSRDLFERIFRQRKDPDQQLLRAAEDLSLLHSIDGEDTSDDGELAQLSAISAIGVRQLYEALVEMHRRGVVQARGRFRAILPQAIANALAADALEPSTRRFRQILCRATRKDAQISVAQNRISARLGNSAQSTVTRWLQADGPVGDLFAIGELGVQVITNIAPVAPEAVLEKLERELSGLAPSAPDRHRWLSLIRRWAMTRICSIAL